MKKKVVVILVDNRSKVALDLQKMLTEYGCIIKTRLGIHDGVGNQCSESGLIILELAGDQEKQKELIEKLSNLEKIDVKEVNLEL